MPTCSTCAGLGYLERTCKLCDGAARIRCFTCEAEGTIGCPRCNGLGGPCPNCDGAGRVRCLECEGTGKIECECYGGKERVACPECQQGKKTD